MLLRRQLINFKVHTLHIITKLLKQNIVCQLMQIVPAMPSILEFHSFCSPPLLLVCFQAKIPTNIKCVCIHACAHASTLIKLISRCGVSFPLSLCYGEPSVRVRLWEKIINSGASAEESIAKTDAAATRRQRSKSFIFKLFQHDVQIPQPRGSFSASPLSCAQIQLLLTSLNANTWDIFHAQPQTLTQCEE